MPFDIEGWIEVKYYADPTDATEDIWVGVIVIDSLVRNDTVSEKLFGLSKRCVAYGYTIESLAASRGLPPNLSGHMKMDLEQIAQLEQEYGDCGCGGMTHVYWDEIRDFQFDEEEQKESSWILVFDLMRRLAQKYSGVRLIAWYKW